MITILRVLWAVLGAIAVIGIISFGLYDDSPEIISTTVSEPTERLLVPTIFQAESQSSKVIPKSFHASSEINSISNNDSIPTLIQKADAITSDQNEISVTQYTFQNRLERGVTVDDSGNMFAGGSNKVGRIDVTANTQTTWTIPNDQNFGNGGDVDSTGFLYFGLSVQEQAGGFGNGGIIKIAKLNHNTDIFTEWTIPITTQCCDIRDLIIDSSDNVYYSDINSPEFLAKLNPSTNVVTKYFVPEDEDEDPILRLSKPNKLTIDDSDILYFITYDYEDSKFKLIKFDPNTNALTVWIVPNESDGDIGLSSDGKIYFGENFQFRHKIAELDPSTNVLKEWTNPFDESIGDVIVDGSGNVFFASDFYRFVPSTNTFTQWDLGTRNFIEINSDGEIIGNNDERVYIIS